jgi:hypothetical protein
MPHLEVYVRTKLRTVTMSLTSVLDTVCSSPKTAKQKTLSAYSNRADARCWAISCLGLRPAGRPGHTVLYSPTSITAAICVDANSREHHFKTRLRCQSVETMHTWPGGLCCWHTGKQAALKSKTPMLSQQKEALAGSCVFQGSSYHPGNSMQLQAVCQSQANRPRTSASLPPASTTTMTHSRVSHHAGCKCHSY